MKRVGLLVLGGVVLTGGAMVAAARWVPGAMQPAGARAELTRLVVQAVEEVDAMLGTAEDAEPMQLATEDEADAAPATEEHLLPIRTVPASMDCASATPVEFRGLADSNCRLHIVMFRSEEARRVESRWARRDLLKKS